MQAKMMRPLPAFFLLAVALFTSPSAPGQAQRMSHTFPETGKTVAGRFLEYWLTHGGLAQQGYPISNEMQEVSETDGRSYAVQYFERAVFEKHPENTPPNDVLLSLLGVFYYNEKYPSGRPSGIAGQTQPGTCTATHDDSDVDSGRGFTPEAPERQVVGKGLVLTGRVLSSRDCAPIAGAKLEMRPELNNSHPEAQRATLRTDASGRYRFESNFPEHIHMRVSAHGFRTIITNLFHTTPGKSADTFDVVLVPDPSCRLFPETGQALCGTFLDYWNKNGGLAQQGYPISDEFNEKSDLDGKTYKVQYFQRAVFEHHPENVPPHNVLLSQLGTFRYRQKYSGSSTPISPPAPPASTTATPVPSATFTHTPVPPTETPKPTKTSTPVPTTCPSFGTLNMVCERVLSWAARIRWNVSGGGGQVEGEITAEEENGHTETWAVSGRSGETRYGLGCELGSGGPEYVSFSLELHDECGNVVSAECGVILYRDPCP